MIISDLLADATKAGDASGEFRVVIATRIVDGAEVETHLSNCRLPYNVDTWWIGKSDIEMWEGAGNVIAVVTGPERDVVIVAELSGEGETWLWSGHYELTGDDRLSDWELPNSEKVRCPASMNGRPVP